MIIIREPSDFSQSSTRWERPELQATRVRVLDDSGEQWDGYQLPGGRIVGRCLRVPGPARLATMQAANDAAKAIAAKDDAARTVIKNRAAAILAKAPATRTADERWQLSVSWLLFREGE